MKQLRAKKVASTLEEVLDPRYTALIVVDVQNDFCKEGGAFEKAGKNISMSKAVVPKIRLALDAARKCGAFVVFIQNVTLPDGLSDSPASIYRKLKAHSFTDYVMAGTWGCQIVDDVAPIPGETIVTKHRPSAFVGTNLDLVLRSNGIKSIAMTGVVTEGCVESTARDASFHDYYVVYVKDCMASISLEMHEAILRTAAYRGHDVVSSEMLIGLWVKGSGLGL